MIKEGVQVLSAPSQPSKRRKDIVRLLLERGNAADDILEEDLLAIEETLAKAGYGETVSEEELRAFLAGYCWPLTAEERADLEEAEREIERGEVASDEEVARVLRLGHP